MGNSFFMKLPIKLAFQLQLELTATTDSEVKI
jgi:hypothetical protein